MALPLMPKATAVWLVENSTLTFRQIAAFCGLHELEVQAIADDEVAIGMQGMDPIACGELTQEEIDRCTDDSSASLKMAKPNVPIPKLKQKGARYTPVSKRQDRPDAISWLLKNYPELSDAQISRLIGTTKPTINAVRERTHWNMSQIKPRNPVGLGLCSSPDLEKMVAVARARAGTVHAAASDKPKAAPPPAPKPAPEPAPEPQDAHSGPMPDINTVFAPSEPAPASDDDSESVPDVNVVFAPSVPEPAAEPAQAPASEPAPAAPEPAEKTEP